MSVLGRALRAAGDRSEALQRPLWRMRRSLFCARIKTAAAWHRAEVALDVAPDVRIGRRVQVRIEPFSSNELRLGAGSVVDDDVRILLRGGRIRAGERVEIRRGGLINVAGTLTMAGDDVLSWSVVVHCAEAIDIGRFVVTAEFVTIVDSVHYFTEPDAFVYHNTRAGTAAIGDNSWIGAKATIGRGAAVGRHCIVAAGSLVTDEVPDGHLASGVPAQVVRALDLPWERPESSSS